ncbi:gluconokinase [Alicyclobacillus acidiphilus]|uniref:gluconokinase n=1 Tax=Alicyclobacillus acidiphilus TaxID=182455 RepID=UPI000831966A|nr:gluconokinase [Alicyclobacillus acidiphilus]
MNKQVCIVGLDLGTTSLKAVAYALDGGEIGSHSVLVETSRDEHGKAVQQPESIFQAATDSLRQLASSLREQGVQVASLGFSAAMHSLIPMDHQHQPLFPAMTWMDARPGEEAQNLWAADIGKDIYRRTGTPIHAMAPIAKIGWLRSHHPDIFAKASRFVSIKEYVWHRWFGRWEVDYAMASATGLFDADTLTWYPPALEWAGIEERNLATPVPLSYARLAEELLVDLDLPFAPDAKICIGGSDGVLATLAAGVMDGKSMILTLGTSLALRMGLHRPHTDVVSRTFCYILDESHYVLGGPSNSGGVVLDWLYRNVFTVDGEEFDKRFPVLCEEAGDVEPGDLFCLPYLSGERAPLWDESAFGTFVGLKIHHRQVHLMRAAIEGMLFNAYWIAQTFTNALGKPDKLIVSGKLFQQGWVRQWIADLFQLAVETQAEIDGATYGAALVAAKVAELDLAPPALRQGDVVQPREEHGPLLHARFNQYRAWCERLGLI